MRLSNITFAVAVALSALGHRTVFAAPVGSTVATQYLAVGDTGHLDVRANPIEVSSLDAREANLEPTLVTRGGRAETPAERRARLRRIKNRKRRQGGHRPGVGVQPPKKSFGKKFGKILQNPNTYTAAGHALGGAVTAYANHQQSRGKESRLAPIAGVYNGIVNANNG